MNPSRIAIHGKLLEIFAKRRDVRAFEALAGDAFKLCAGEGAEWERICEFGRELDQDNPFTNPVDVPRTRPGRPMPKSPWPRSSHPARSQWHRIRTSPLIIDAG